MRLKQQLFRLTRRRRAGCPAGCAPPAPPSLRGLQSRGACGHRVSGAAAPSLLPGVEILAIQLVAKLLFLPLVLRRLRRLRAACSGGSGPRLRRRINQLPLPCTASLARYMHSHMAHAAPQQQAPSPAHQQSRARGRRPGPWVHRPQRCPPTWGAPLSRRPAPARAVGLQAVREMNADSGEGLKQLAAFPSRQLLLHAYTGQGSSRDQQTTAPAQSAHRSGPVWVGRPAPRGRPGWRLHSRRFGLGRYGRPGGHRCSTEQAALHMPNSSSKDPSDRTPGGQPSTALTGAAGGGGRPRLLARLLLQLRRGMGAHVLTRHVLAVCGRSRKASRGDASVRTTPQ